MSSTRAPDGAYFDLLVEPDTSYNILIEDYSNNSDEIIYSADSTLYKLAVDGRIHILSGAAIAQKLLNGEVKLPSLTTLVREAIKGYFGNPAVPELWMFHFVVIEPEGDCKDRYISTTQLKVHFYNSYPLPSHNLAKSLFKTISNVSASVERSKFIRLAARIGVGVIGLIYITTIAVATISVLLFAMIPIELKTHIVQLLRDKNHQLLPHAKLKTATTFAAIILLIASVTYSFKAIFTGKYDMDLSSRVS